MAIDLEGPKYWLDSGSYSDANSNLNLNIHSTSTIVRFLEPIDPFYLLL